MSKKIDPKLLGEAPYTIRRLTRTFGVTSRALRFYESRGMLRPSRRGTTRLYSEDDLERLKLILLGKRFAFPLKEIKRMLDLGEQANGAELQRKVALEKLKLQRRVLEQRQRDTAAALDELDDTCMRLERGETLSVSDNNQCG